MEMDLMEVDEANVHQKEEELKFRARDLENDTTYPLKKKKLVETVLPSRKPPAVGVWYNFPPDGCSTKRTYPAFKEFIEGSEKVLEDYEQLFNALSVYFDAKFGEEDKSSEYTAGVISSQERAKEYLEKAKERLSRCKTYKDDFATKYGLVPFSTYADKAKVFEQKIRAFSAMPCALKFLKDDPMYTEFPEEKGHLSSCKWDLLLVLSHMVDREGKPPGELQPDKENEMGEEQNDDMNELKLQYEALRDELIIARNDFKTAIKCEMDVRHIYCNVAIGDTFTLARWIEWTDMWLSIMHRQLEILSEEDETTADDLLDEWYEIETDMMHEFHTLKKKDQEERREMEKKIYEEEMNEFNPMLFKIV